MRPAIFFLAAAACFGQSQIDFRTQVKNKTADQVTYTAPGAGAVPSTVQTSIAALGPTVMGYGAKCDGNTNDLAAFRAGIAAQSALGAPGTLYVPAGTCVITDTSTTDVDALLLTSPVSLIGPGTIVFNLPAPSTASVTACSEASNGTVTITAAFPAPDFQPTMLGDDTHGEITVGSTATGCTLTFQQAYSNAPECTITNQSMSVVNAMTYTISNSAFTIAMTGAGGDKIDYHCEGMKGPN